MTRCVRGPVGRVGSAWARVTLGKGPGAPACHVSVEGESRGRALPTADVCVVVRNSDDVTMLLNDLGKVIFGLHNYNKLKQM